VHRSMVYKGFWTPLGVLLLIKGGGSEMDILSGGPLVIGGANLLDPKYFHHMPSNSLHHSETSSSTDATCSACSQVMSHLITTVSPYCQSLTPFTHEQPLIATFTTNSWPPHHPSVCFGHRHLPPHPKWPVVHLLQVNLPVILLTCLPRSIDPSFE
jgi:hypothetical protein